MGQLSLTQHAKERLCTRSIRMADLDLFERLSDIEVAARRGAVHLRLSRRAADEAIRRGLDATQVARLLKLNIVERDGRVLTAYRLPQRPSQSTARNVVSAVQEQD